MGTRSERVKREMWETEAGLELPFGTVTSGQLYFSVILKGFFNFAGDFLVRTERSPAVKLQSFQIHLPKIQHFPPEFDS